MLLQQRQQQLHLLERVSGRAQSRSSPTQGRYSPHSAASTEVDWGVKKQEDNLSNSAADSTDAAATPAVTTLEETQDFEYTLGNPAIFASPEPSLDRELLCIDGSLCCPMSTFWTLYL